MANNEHGVRFSRVDDVTTYVEAMGEEQIIDGRPYVRAVVPREPWVRVLDQGVHGEVRVGPIGQAMGVPHDVVEIQDPPHDPGERTIEGKVAIVVRTCRQG